MTEQEWLTASDPMPMLTFVRGKAGDRKLILFVCACLRGMRKIPTDESYWTATEKVERQPSQWHQLQEAVQAIKERMVINQDFFMAAVLRDIERAMRESEEGFDKA